MDYRNSYPQQKFEYRVQNSPECPLWSAEWLDPNDHDYWRRHIIHEKATLGIALEQKSSEQLIFKLYLGCRLIVTESEFVSRFFQYNPLEDRETKGQVRIRTHVVILIAIRWHLNDRDVVYQYVRTYPTWYCYLIMSPNTNTLSLFPNLHDGKLVLVGKIT